MAELYESGFYNTGTASIAQGQTVVMGQGTAWRGIVRPADDFGKHVGRPIPIASVDSDTQITLAYPWQGPTQVAAPYRITFTPYEVTYRQALQEIGKLLVSGNVSALADLVGAAGKIPLFTGAGTMEVTDLKSAPKAILGLDGENGKFPVFTGASSAAARDLVGTVGQIGGIPSGAIFERGSNANGEYVRYADGTQICWKTDVTFTRAANSIVNYSWTFPATFSSIPAGIPMCSRPNTIVSYTGDITLQSVGSMNVTTGGTTTAFFGYSRIDSSPLWASGSILNCRIGMIGRWF